MKNKEMNATSTNTSNASENANVNATSATESIKETVNPFAENKAAILADLKALVAEYNESATFAEFKRMQGLDKKIADKVSEYTSECEAECFAQLLKAENPLYEAAKALCFSTVKVKDEKQEGGGTHRIIDTEATKPIDTLKLHNKAKDGIGANKDWHYMIQRLNLELTARRAIELGLDPKKVRDSYAMADEARKLEGFATESGKFSWNKANEHLKANMQKCVDAMIGEGFEVKTPVVNYLLSIFTRKDNARSLSVTAANHKYMRQYMLEVCNAAMNGTAINMNYQAKK